MMITKGNIGNLSLDNFVEEVSGIYREKDKKRSIWDIWFHASHHAASIGEEIRKQKPGARLLEEIAEFSMWLFTFVGKIKDGIGVPLGKPERPEESAIRIKWGFSDLIWNKYPNMCPVCFWRRIKRGMNTSDSSFDDPCDCLLHEVESRAQTQIKEHIKKLHKYAETAGGNKPTSVDEWQKMFFYIYEANLRHFTLTDIAFHLLEEVGEVSDAMVRMYTYAIEEFQSGAPSWQQAYLENEIADVTSWVFTLVNKMRLVEEIVRGHYTYILGPSESEVFPTIPYTLSRILWNCYGSNDLQSLWCPLCKQTKCECPIYLVRTPKELAKLKDYAVDVLT